MSLLLFPTLSLSPVWFVLNYSMIKKCRSLSGSTSPLLPCPRLVFSVTWLQAVLPSTPGHTAAFTWTSCPAWVVPVAVPQQGSCFFLSLGRASLRLSPSYFLFPLQVPAQQISSQPHSKRNVWSQAPTEPHSSPSLFCYCGIFTFAGVMICLYLSPAPDHKILGAQITFVFDHHSILSI